MKIIDEGKPEERIKEVEKAPLIKSKNPPLIHLTDEERLFIQNQLEMFRKEKITQTQHNKPMKLMPCQQTFL